MTALLLPGFAGAQIGVQDGVNVGKVYVTGDNPGIRLLDKAGGVAVTDVSYWRIVWSPAGPGRIAYITTGDGQSPSDLRIALVTNRKLYDFMTREIMGIIDTTIATRPFTLVDATFVDPGQGTFNEAGDTMKERRVSFTSPKYSGSLVGRDFYPEPFQIDMPVGNPRISFGVCTLFIPAKSADVIVNGKKMSGNVYPEQFGPAQSSSAFLAFSESWVK